MSGFLLSLVVTACGGSTSDPLLTTDPWDRCPVPGQGVALGGTPGSEDSVQSPLRRVVLMGGGSENDAAATLLVEGAAGGDVVILRATGSVSSYPNYFTIELSPIPAPSSAVTVLTNDPTAGDDPSALCWLAGAEAVWLAGGDQSDYLIKWPVGLQAALAQAQNRGVSIGGTSAGAVSLGEAAFDARLGTVTSQEALGNPLDQSVSLSYPSFFAEELSGFYVDSHFADRDREGRLFAFLARFLSEKSRSEVFGLGLDEGVAVVIEGGSFEVYSGGEGAAWLYRVTGPAQLEAGQPLELSGITRTRLGNGADGSWPPIFSELQGVDLRVRGGVVEVVF